MKFRTEIFLQKSSLKISHQDKILLAGSCFAENMQAYFRRFLFDVLSNPHGVIYNPVSLHRALQDVAKKEIYELKDLHFYNELYFSAAHHTSFSDTDSSVCLEKINTSITQAHQHLQNANVLIITLGSAYVYAWNETGANYFGTPSEIVANCHKLPNTFFQKRLLSLEEIVQTLQDTIRIFPDKKIIFTVSPVRHWRDGAVENMRSKSLLIEAIHRVAEQSAAVYYFPAFELMMDDLRDYRFYEEDLLHPNKTAVNYIWDKFAATFFDEETQLLNKKIDAIQAMKSHRPRFEDTQAYQAHKQKIEQEINVLTTQYPYLDFTQK